MNLVRSPNLVAYWKGKYFQIEEFEKRRRTTLAPVGVLLLDEFSEPRNPSRVARSFPPYTPSSVRAEIGKLRRLGFLVPARGRASQSGLAEAWQGSFAAAYYHFSTRDLLFTAEPQARTRLLRRLLASTAAQPELYKNYPGKPRVSLSRGGLLPPGLSLDKVLRRRTTVRTFEGRLVSRQTFASVIRATWGQTGWIDAGPLGKLLTKTSPSGGARHPIECYVIVLRVDGLLPGLYHYSVQKDALERLRAGRLSRNVVQIASQQKWLSRAAFVCVMTAVVDRTFWKYSPAIGYRALYLDAGHLAQTFCLVATALGLGPFTTAAIQQSETERLLGVDGVREFPLYLCGAGIPTRRKAEAAGVTA